jgi:hypothetical protein
MFFSGKMSSWEVVADSLCDLINRRVRADVFDTRFVD